MGKIALWLKKDVPAKKIWIFIIGALLIKILYHCFLTEILDIQPPPLKGNGIPILTWDFPILLIWMVAVEEAFFRLPLAGFVENWGMAAPVWIAMIVMSLIFGIGHGGLSHIPLQGVGGLIYSILFLKCGGFQKKYLKAFLTVTLTHFLYNAIAIALILASGGTKI